MTYFWCSFCTKCPKITLYYGHSMLTWRAVSARLLIHRCPSVGPYVPIRRAQTKKRIYRIRLTLTKMSKDIEKHLYLNKCFSLIGYFSIQRRWTDIQRRWTAVQSRWTDIQRRWTKNSPWCINNLYQEKKVILLYKKKTAIATTEKYSHCCFIISLLYFITTARSWNGYAMNGHAHPNLFRAIQTYQSAP